MSDMQYISHVKMDSEMNFTVTPLAQKIPSLESLGMFDAGTIGVGYDRSSNPTFEVPAAYVSFVGLKGESNQSTPQSAQFVGAMTDGQAGQSVDGVWPMRDDMSAAMSGLNKQAIGEDFLVSSVSHRFTNSPIVVFRYNAFQNDLSSGRVTGEGHFS